MKTVNHNIMVRQASATVRILTIALLLADSVLHGSAQERLPPPSVTISMQQPMYAGRRYEVVCRSVGWTTTPNMVWWLGVQQQLTSMQQLMVSEGRNESVSTLLLQPLPDDNGKTLKCQSEDASGIQTASVNILVFYPPIVSTYVEPPLRAESIIQGNNVTLNCHVRASPPIWSVKWIFQGRVIQDSDASTPVSEALTLRLKSIHHRMAGNYTCIVSNALGDAESVPLQLTVMHLPVCRYPQPLVYYTPLDEMVEMDCGGEGVPPVDTYRWMFGRALNADVQPTQLNINTPDGEKITFLEWANGASWRTYRPATEYDYGAFYCNAKNALGLQRKPCVFYIVPPGKPNPPANCSVMNMTSSSFAVHCRTTRDHGFRQRYVLEVFDAYTGQVKFNKTQKVPVFRVDGLEPNRATTMRMAAFSPRGRSEWLRMNVVTRLPSSPRTSIAFSTRPAKEEDQE